MKLLNLSLVLALSLSTTLASAQQEEVPRAGSFYDAQIACVTKLIKTELASYGINEGAKEVTQALFQNPFAESMWYKYEGSMPSPFRAQRFPHVGVWGGNQMKFSGGIRAVAIKDNNVVKCYKHQMTTERDNRTDIMLGTATEQHPTFTLKIEHVKFE